MLIVLASEGALAASVWTSKLRLVPETLPAGKVTLPEAAVWSLPALAVEASERAAAPLPTGSVAPVW